MKLSIIDEDSLPYILGYTYKDADYPTMMQQVDNFMWNILTATNAELYVGFLGGEKCFRYSVATTKPYKGTRKEKPDWLAHWQPLINQHLINEWGAVVCNKVEADDAVGILWKKYKDEYTVTIAGCDKDLKQFSGNHYDYKKCEHSYLSQRDSNLLFWTQMIVGDTADGIPGLKGKGPAFADKLLSFDYAFGPGYPQVVKEAYRKVHGEQAEQIYREQYTLLKMLEQPAYGFTIPELLPVPFYDPLTPKTYTCPESVPSLTNNYLTALGLD